MSKQIHIPWTKEDEESLRILCAEGLSAPEISCRMGRTVTSVRKKKELFVGKTHFMKKWSSEEESQLISLFSEGKKAPEIARILRRPLPSVRTKKLEIMKVLPPRKQTRTNIDFFRELTPDSAYVLGIIATDGCVYANKEVIVNQSHEVGKEFLVQLQGMTGGSVFAGCGKSRAHRASNRLILYGKEIVAIVNGYGIVERKTRTLEFPKLTKDTFPHFMRGVIDGDGCIFIQKAEERGRHTPRFSISFVTASFPFISGALAYFEECGLPIPAVSIKGNVFNAVWTTLDAIAFCDWIYKDSTPQTRLERKYKKFVDYLTIRSGARYIKRKGTRPADPVLLGNYTG